MELSVKPIEKTKSGYPRALPKHEGKGITHPVTNVSMTAKHWALKYRVAYGTFRGWQLRFEMDYIFQCLDAGIHPTKKMGRNPNVWVHPVTNVRLTTSDWAEAAGEKYRAMQTKLCREGADALLDYPELLKVSVASTEAPPKGLLSLAEEVSGAKNGVVFYRHPKFDISLPLYAWARHYRVEIADFYRKLKQFNGDLGRLFLYFDLRHKS